MQPNVFSEEKIKRGEAKGWYRAGYNISYSSSKINRLMSSRKVYFMLSFDFSFEYDDNTVWFAYAIPYTFTKLSKFIESINENPYIQVSQLCKSLSGLDVPLITLTNFEMDDENKEYIVISARVHPGETHGSWMMEGFISYLLSNAKSAKFLRDSVLFKIIPMLNPDGVVVGNSRVALAGNDLNRKY